MIYSSHKFVCSLIDPIYNGRGLNTPYEASRLVSLIPYERKENTGVGKSEMWMSTHSVISVMKGDINDHAVLLCSLLLGFSLDAYVGIGNSMNGPHLWVITRNKVQNNKFEVTFWESLTGQRISLEDDSVCGFYKHIHCVFNDSHFYANIQINDDVLGSNYNFEDEFLWKPIDSDKIKDLKKYCHNPTMDTMDIKEKDKFKMETEIEKSLKSRIFHYRKGKN